MAQAEFCESGGRSSLLARLAKPVGHNELLSDTQHRKKLLRYIKILNRAYIKSY